jgi:hypothetical protein
LAALLIGALLFATSRDRGVSAQSVPTVTATATATVTWPTSEPSNQSTDIGGEEPTIQLEVLADSARPFQPVGSRVRTAVEQISFCGCSAGREASGWTSRCPRRPISRASSPLLSSLGSRVVTGFACYTLCLAVHRAAARSRLGIVIVMRWMHPTLGRPAAMCNDASRGNR